MVSWGSSWWQNDLSWFIFTGCFRNVNHTRGNYVEHLKAARRVQKTWIWKPVQTALNLRSRQLSELPPHPNFWWRSEANRLEAGSQLRVWLRSPVSCKAHCVQIISFRGATARIERGHPDIPMLHYHSQTHHTGYFSGLVSSSTQTLRPPPPTPQYPLTGNVPRVAIKCTMTW